MEGEAISVELLLESVQGIKAKCCAVDESLLNALALLKASKETPSRDETPHPNEEAHASTPSTSIFSSSSAPQRRKDEVVSILSLPLLEGFAVFAQLQNHGESATVSRKQSVVEEIAPTECKNKSSDTDGHECLRIDFVENQNPRHCFFVSLLHPCYHTLSASRCFLLKS
jgi:hypothetical protein